MRLQLASPSQHYEIDIGDVEIINFDGTVLSVFSQDGGWQELLNFSIKNEVVFTFPGEQVEYSTMSLVR